MSQSQKAIGIDLGGTHIKAVLIDEKGSILKKVHIPTDDHKKEAPWKAAIKTCFLELAIDMASQSPIVGLSAPGIPNGDFSAIACMPGRLEGLENFQWAEYLGLGQVPVVNDAVAALIAEYHFGAGKGYKNLVLITLGTGVGGALLIDGKIHLGFMQKAGHFGHLTLSAPSFALDSFQIPDSLEDAIGNHNIFQRSFGRYTTTKDLVKGYEAHEPIASYVWLTSVQKLAAALASIGNMVSPECILIGGGIAQADSSLFTPLKEFMDIYEWRPGKEKMNIQKVAYDDFAGAIGAAQNARINIQSKNFLY
ncbi:MAG: ROK family protein [Bacteroidota bacterium]